ncbi:host attachment protein [bacterium]|nr:host attachment protein [bacterium]
MTVETLVLVADSARARLFAAHRSRPSWELLEAFDHPRGAVHDRDILTDRPGRVHQSTADGRRSGADPKTSPHEVEAEVFARQLAAALADAVTARHPQRVVLVAPPRFLGHLRAVLDKPVSALLAPGRDEDLSAVADRDLPGRLADLL